MASPHKEEGLYRHGEARVLPPAFSFDRDSRGVIRRLSAAARRWRIFLTVCALLAVAFASEAWTVSRVEGVLGAGTALGCLIAAAVGKFGYNRFAHINADTITDLAANLLWGFVDPASGMVVFTSDRLFIESGLILVPLSDVDRIELDAEAKRLHLGWRVQGGTEEAIVVRESSRTIELPDYARGDEAKARVALLLARKRPRAERGPA